MIGSNIAGNGVKPLIFKAFGGFAPRVAAAMACMTFMLLIFMASGAFAQARPALFLGLMNDKGEPVQSEMEQSLRNAFAANPKIKLIDKVETQRIVREKERLGRANVENFIPPGAKLDSSTVIIKGIVQDPEFKIKRHWLLWGKIDARLAVKFYFEEISGTAEYQGDFNAAAMKGKDFLLFAPARKNIHISAADRNELLGGMQSKIVKEVSDFASTFFNALTADNDAGTDTADTVNQENEPPEPEPADSRAADADVPADSSGAGVNGD